MGRGVKKPFSTEPCNLTNRNAMGYNGLVNTKAVGVSAAADNKGFVVTTKRAKLAHKPSKATLAVTMKAGLGRSLHKTKANLNKQRYRKDLTKAAMRGQLPLSGHRSLCQRGKAPRLLRPRRNKKRYLGFFVHLHKGGHNWVYNSDTS